MLRKGLFLIVGVILYAPMITLLTMVFTILAFRLSETPSIVRVLTVMAGWVSAVITGISVGMLIGYFVRSGGRYIAVIGSLLTGAFLFLGVKLYSYKPDIAIPIISGYVLLQACAYIGGCLGERLRLKRSMAR